MNPKQLAKNNGDWGEKIAEKIIKHNFGDFTFLNDVIDYKTDIGVFIEIKTCQKFINSSNPQYPIRLGRFVLKKHQHTYLSVNDGYYIFFVKNNDMLIKGLIIPAKSIIYKNLISWKRLFQLYGVSGDNINKTQLDSIMLPQTDETLKIDGKHDFVDKTEDGI